MRDAKRYNDLNTVHKKKTPPGFLLLAKKMCFESGLIRIQIYINVKIPGLDLPWSIQGVDINEAVSRRW